MGRGVCAEAYPNGQAPATGFDLDGDTPQAVVAYVSRSNIYVVDQHLNVVAYGRLMRREVLE